MKKNNMYQTLFISPNKKQIIKEKQSQIIELLYIDFLKRYDDIFKRPLDIERCTKIYKQLKKIEF